RLLLVLDHDEARFGVVEDALHLVGQGIDEDSEGDGAGRLGAELRVHPGRAIPRDDRDRVSASQAQCDEAQTHGTNVTRVLLPGHLLPDAVLLLAERDLPGAVAPGAGGEQLRERGRVHGEPSVATRPRTPRRDTP